MRSDARRLLMAVLVAALCLPTLAAADDEKPVFSIATKSIEASIQIEDTLKAYPGLYDNLLTEGRRELSKWRATADKDRKETPDIFRDGRLYNFERSYSLRSAVGRYVSVVRADYMNSLAAHPNRLTNTILWDAEAKKRVSLRPLFKETVDDGPTLQTLAKEIRTVLLAEKKAREIPVEPGDIDTGLGAVKPKLLAIGAIALAPSTEAGKSAGLISYFSPYQVGAYVEGDYTAFIPWTEFKPYLSPEGAALFAGERPQGDADKD